MKKLENQIMNLQSMDFILCQRTVIIKIALLSLFSLLLFIIPFELNAQSNNKVKIDAVSTSMGFEKSAISTEKNFTTRFSGAFHGISGVSFPFGGSVARATSANGIVVVGTSESTSGIDQAFRWDAFEIDPLGNLPGGKESIALDVSADGVVIIGYGTISNGLFEGFRWTEAGGIEGLGFLHSGEGWSEAWGVSADGSVIVGRSSSPRGIVEAFCWVDGHMVSLGDLPGGDFSSAAFDVSADGSVIVGEGESNVGDKAVVWIDGLNIDSLFTGGNFEYSTARGVSADGSVVVGHTSSNGATFVEAFRFDLHHSEFEGLGDLPGGRYFSRASGVSSDGSIIVGQSHTGIDVGSGFEAYIWTDSHHGMRNLKVVAEESYGLDLTGWTLLNATDVSISERGIVTIVGFGINPDGLQEGWRMVLPVFPGIGDLPGGGIYSIAYSASSDGSIVVGTGSSNEAGRSEAFRWENGILSGLGGLGDDIESEAVDISADGSVIVGESRATSGVGIEAFRWTRARGMAGLGDLPGGHPWPFSQARAVSSDGEVVVGRGESENGMEAFLWKNDHMSGLGDFPGGRFQSEANEVSGDGSVVVGRGLSEKGLEAFLWTDNSGMIGLGDLPGGNFSSVAHAVSYDGSEVVGGSQSKNGFEAFIWTENEGMKGLGDLPGGDFSSIARDVSDWGSIVVGKSETDEGFPFGFEAFIWTEKEGMKRLEDLAVKEYGATLQEWVFAEAEDIAIAGDSTVVVSGYGINPLGLTEGFRIPLSGFDVKSVIVSHPLEPGDLDAQMFTQRTTNDNFSTPVDDKINPVQRMKPTNGVVTFPVSVHQGQHVSVEVYDDSGRLIRLLYDGILPAWMKRVVTFDTSALPDGVYVIRADGDSYSQSWQVEIGK